MVYIEHFLFQDGLTGHAIFNQNGSMLMLEVLKKTGCLTIKDAIVCVIPMMFNDNLPNIEALCK